MSKERKLKNLTILQISKLLEDLYMSKVEEPELYKAIYDKCEDWYRASGASNDYNIAHSLHDAGALQLLSIPIMDNSDRNGGRKYLFKKVKING